LDGVGNHNGLVFVLTTNFKDQLDAALIRDGRVDLRVRFDYCTSEQMSKLFDTFYPQKETSVAQSDETAKPSSEADSVDPEVAALEAKLAALKRTKAATADGKAEEAKVPSGAAFSDALLVSLGDRQVTAAQLQSFFVSHRKCSAAEAIADVGAIAAAIDKREQEDADAKAETPEAKEAAKPAAKPADGAEPAGCKTGAASDGKAVHVHIHTSAA